MTTYSKQRILALGVQILTLKQHYITFSNLAFMSPREMEIIIHGFVSSRLDYCKMLQHFLATTSTDWLLSVKKDVAMFLNRS